MNAKNWLAVLIIAVVALGYPTAYVVDETEQVVVTQFGRAKVVGSPKQEPGLYFKLPVIQHTNYFPKIFWPWNGEPGQIPT